MPDFTVRRSHRSGRRWSTPGESPAIVAIPARNEAGSIGNCLDALARAGRAISGPAEALIVLNGCTDNTWAVTKDWMKRHDFPVTLIEVTLAEHCDHAGGARACALTLALQALGTAADGAVLTTDADSRVMPDWLQRSIAGVAAGNDVVAGAINLEPGTAQQWPLPLRWRHGLETQYAALLDEIDALCDPRLHDPWPNHRQWSGASLAFRASALRSLGAIPSPACGEDRAIVAACLARDLRVRHDALLRVETSGRLVGRASGGMADTLRCQSTHGSQACDPALEPCSRLVRRASLRAHARTVFTPGMTDMALAAAVGARWDATTAVPCHFFGKAWQRLEACSPTLRRVPIVPADLHWETGEARAWLSTRTRDWTTEVAA